MTFDLVTGIKWYLVFILSTTLHEAAHAWTALRLGDDTAHRGGLVTLDPTPHIRRSPIGMVVVPILSYVLRGWMIGWASAPFDPRWAVANPRRSALMSLAGPASNLLLVILSGILMRGGVACHFFDAPASIGFSHVVDAHSSSGFFFATILSIFFSLNLLLCAFNLLPVPPLDGSGALLIFARPESAERLLGILRNPQFQIFGLFVAWKLFDFIYPPIQIHAINLLFYGESAYNL